MRVGETRVLLDVVVEHVDLGRSAEQIASEFPSLTIDLARGVAEFYAAHRVEVVRYLDRRMIESQRIEKQIRMRQGQPLTRKMLEARLRTHTEPSK